MTSRSRGLLLASLSISVLALAACGTTSGSSNMTDKSASSRVDAVLERAAREAKASGNRTETAELLERVYQRNSDDPAIATSYAQALRDDEQLNRARQVIYPFTEGKNAYPDAVVELSMIQLALGQYKDAEQTANRAVDMDGNSGRAYLALGTALDAQNEHEEAETAFREGLDKWKGDPTPILNNLALNLASQNKLDQALDMLAKAREISPGRVEIERNMRIISTLKEGADDFLTKQDQKPAAPPVAARKEAPKPATAPAEKAAAKKPEAKPVKQEAKKDVSRDEIDNKQLPKKEAVKAVAPEKVEPAASSKPAKTQNFKSRSE